MNYKKLLTFFLLFVAANFLFRFLFLSTHRMVFGINPYVGPLILLLVSLAITPLVVKGYKWIKKNQIGKIQDEVAILFLFGLLTSFILWVFSENPSLHIDKIDLYSIDIQIHGTYYIVSDLGVLLFFILLNGIFSAIYYFFPRIFKRDLMIGLSRIHFWITYGGLYLLVWMSYRVIQVDEPRRYTDIGGFKHFNQFQTINYYVKALWIALMIAQLLFLINVIFTLFRSRPDQGVLLNK